MTLALIILFVVLQPIGFFWGWQGRGPDIPLVRQLLMIVSLPGFIAFVIIGGSLIAAWDARHPQP